MEHVIVIAFLDFDEIAFLFLVKYECRGGMNLANVTVVLNNFKPFLPLPIRSNNILRRLSISFVHLASDTFGGAIQNPKVTSSLTTRFLASLSPERGLRGPGQSKGTSQTEFDSNHMGQSLNSISFDSRT